MITSMIQAVVFGVMFAFLVILIGGCVMGAIWLSLDLLFGDYRNWKAIGRFFVKIGHGFKIAVDWIYEKIVYLAGTKERKEEARQYKINILTRKFTEFKKGKIKC